MTDNRCYIQLERSGLEDLCPYCVLFLDTCVSKAYLYSYKCHIFIYLHIILFESLWFNFFAIDFSFGDRILFWHRAGIGESIQTGRQCFSADRREVLMGNSLSCYLPDPRTHYTTVQGAICLYPIEVLSGEMQRFELFGWFTHTAINSLSSRRKCYK